MLRWIFSSSSSCRRHGGETISSQSPTSHGAGSVVIVQKQQLRIEDIDFSLETLDCLKQLGDMLILRVALGLQLGLFVLVAC